MKKTIIVAVLLLAVLLVLCGCGKQAVNQPEPTSVVTPEPTAEATVEPSESPEAAEETVAETEAAEETPTEAEPTAEATEDTEDGEEAAAPDEAEATPDEATELTEPAEEAEETGSDDLTAEAEETVDTAETEDATENGEMTAAEDTTETGETTEAEETNVPEEPAEEPEPEPTPEPVPEEPRIEITIPAVYAQPSYQIGEVTLEPDGSVIYSLTEEEHERLLRQVHADIQDELDTMCASPYFLHFDSMTASEDCRVFTVVVIDIETSKAEQKSIPQLYSMGRRYAAYQGVEPGNIHIDYMTKIGNTFVTRDSERDGM